MGPMMGRCLYLLSHHTPPITTYNKHNISNVSGCTPISPLAIMQSGQKIPNKIAMVYVMQKKIIFIYFIFEFTKKVVPKKQYILLVLKKCLERQEKKLFSNIPQYTINNKHSTYNAHNTPQYKIQLYTHNHCLSPLPYKNTT